MQSILELFEKTFDDRKFSRAEKQALTQIIKNEDLSKQNIGFIRNRIFEFARQNLISYSSQEVLDWLETANKLLVRFQPSNTPRSEVYFSPGKQCQEAIIRYLRGAQKKVLICVFTISDDRIADEIFGIFNRKLELRVITDDDKTFDRGSDIKRLSKKGINVKMDRTSNHMHHKFALIDDEILITGSYNWTRSAAKYNHENILVSREQSLIKDYTEEFERLWKEFVNFK